MTPLSWAGWYRGTLRWIRIECAGGCARKNSASRDTGPSFTLWPAAARRCPYGNKFSKVLYNVYHRKYSGVMTFKNFVSGEAEGWIRVYCLMLLARSPLGAASTDFHTNRHTQTHRHTYMVHILFICLCTYISYIYM